ncbi:MAG TPA: hypothetical protein VM683_08235, partial [Anaeromyxobacteraceae bacterium]|nr:hypothetical protein [Anaeromyxobacteraceae bacterium]
MPGSASRPPSSVTPPGALAAAAQHLAALIPPLRFATRDGFAGLPRLSGFGELVRRSVERAEAAGAPDSAALRGLLAEAEAFDALALGEKRRALLRVAGHLSALVPVPDELRELAARGRVEVRGSGTTTTPNATATSTAAPLPGPPLASGGMGTRREEAGEPGGTSTLSPAGEEGRERGPHREPPL